MHKSGIQKFSEILWCSQITKFWLDNYSEKCLNEKRKKEKKKRTYRIENFTNPTDLWVKLRNVWIKRVTLILFVTGAFGTVLKTLKRWIEEFEIGGWIETIAKNSIIDRTEYWEEFWRPADIFSQSDSSERLSANAREKKTCQE